MKTYTISFDTKGHDEFIDFIKAYAIICVLIGHTLPVSYMAYGVWAGMQVPLFILVQTFHCYKKEKATVNVSKILRRVMLPFIVLESVVFAAALLFTKNSCKSLLYNIIYNGGFGAGSYYPWIYLQVALLLPLFSLVLKKSGKLVSLVIFLIICEGLEVLCSITDFPENIYRLLAIRYLFLIYLGWLWVKEGVKVNMLTVFLSVISLATIVYFDFFSLNDEPWFFSTGWKFHRWPCYFYVANGLTIILHALKQLLTNIRWIAKGIRIIAAASYEIFLTQMTIYFFFPKSTLNFISNKYLALSLWLLLFWSVSIWGGLLINKLLFSRQKQG